ncbi:MAG: BppU family phage baseplate upper protein [Candidatus Babeliales bacterium]|jgi:hypothetical protein
MKQGNLFPFEYILQYDDGTPIDLSGATVTITMTLDGASSPTVDAETCGIVDATAGKIKYTWQSGETNDVGMYIIEFLVTFVDTSTLSVPSGDIIWMFIMPSLTATVVPP